jgi:hypothetical protein
MMVRRLAVALLPALLLAACESREVEKDLKIVNVHTGWYDAGILGGGQNKLVPSISLELQNISDEEIASVQMQAVFRRVGEQEAWGDHFVRAIDTSGLAAGATTKPIILRSPLGYTGSDSRVKMLENREFVDANVTILGKHGRRTWTKMGEYRIDRQLLTQ